MLERAGAPPVVSDPGEVTIGQPYRSALEAAAEGSVEYEQARRDLIDLLRANRNQPGGFWVAKEDWDSPDSVEASAIPPLAWRPD